MNKSVGGICAALILVYVASAPVARAQDATWNGSTSDFNAAGNWLPTAVPTGTAFFGAAGLPDIQFSASAVLGGITINAVAQAFTFSTTTQTAGMTLVSSGIVNNSSTTPAFRISNGGTVAAIPGLTFLNAASAGNAIIANTDGGVTAFLGNSTAGNASIVNTGGSAFFSGTVFVGSSTAGNAFITNGKGGITQFNPSASAGGATIINNGGTLSGFSIAHFVDALTNPAIAPTASEVGATAFVGTATAGTATIVNNSGGVTAFLGASTAGFATIITNAGGATFFTGASSGGSANLIVNAGGMLDLSAHAFGSMAAGSLTLAAGSSYRIGITAAGQGNAVALSGAATLLGGTVEIIAMAGTYVPNTTYTIMTASQGVTGSFAGVTDDFAFLTPTLSYDANNVYLSLLLGPGAFAAAGQTANQRAVGRGLDAIASSGNLGGIVAALASLRTAQGAPALQALSPEPYADFGTVNTRSSQLFMNAVGRQMAGERGAAVGAPRGVPLAEVCDVASDDTAPRRFSAWLSGIGSTGSVLGDGNASGLTYTLGGTAFGIDYRLDPPFLIGIAGGWVGGSQWVNGFGGNGYTDSLSIALYGSFTQGGFYADALAGYANSSNRLQRVVAIPGQSAAVANGRASANQFLGQLETGYKVGLPFPADTSISPVARLQVGSVNQAGFTESGTSLFNLSVAQQTTTSVRTIFGVDFGASFDLGGGKGGGGRPVDIGLRLGWMHEFADTARPISAAFAAAPVQQFTVFGATPQRDSAVIGLSATAAITDSASLFASYDGEVGGGTDNHALRVGFRLTW